MARPRKDNAAALAPAKIEQAFWSLLEQQRYADITVSRIIQEAGVNRNSFYYHYQDIEDLAYKAFMNNAEPAAAGALFSSLLSLQQEEGQPSAPPDPALVPHARKIMLYAGSDSAFLNRMVYDLLKEMWFGELAIEESLLSPAEKLQVHFIFSGLVAALGSPEVKESPKLMAILSQTDIGTAAIAVLKGIARAQAPDV